MRRGLGFHNRRSPGVFSPLSLFAGGVEGAWFDPSDPTTLFSDRAGTTPCAAPGAGALVPVGLMLDKSRGLTLGANIQNGGFDSDTVWTKNGWTISGGTASYASGAGAAIEQASPVTLTAGDWVRVTVTISAITSGYVYAWVAGSTSSALGGAATRTPSAGTHTWYFPIATVTNQNVGIYCANGPSGIVIDNVSIQKVSGNHAIAANDTTARPELSARVNLLTYSEQFENAAWSKTNITITQNTAVAPDGTTTADTCAGAAGSAAYFNQSVGVVAGVGYAFVIYAKTNTTSILQIAGGSTGFASSYANFDLSDGSLGTVSGSVAAITSVGNGWWRCQVTQTASNSDVNNFFIALVPSKTSARVANLTANASVFLWGADLRVANIGTTIPAYQRVADQYTYDTVGFPRYLAANGTSSAMSTPGNIPFATVTSDGQARRNLLNNPTQFDATATWSSVTNVSVSANSTAAPDGTATADTLTEAATTSTHWLGAAPSSILITTVQYTLSIYAKDNGRRYFQVYFGGGVSPVFYGNFDLVGIATGSSSAATTLTISDAGNGWRRCSITFTSVASGATSVIFALINSASAAALASYAGDGTSGVFLWGAQLETGSTATAFQNIGTDKATVFAGVRKNADVSIIAEFSANAGTNNGAFLLATGGWGGENGTYVRQSRGTATSFAQPATNSYPSPRSDVLTGTSDIAGDSVVLRINGTQVATSATDQGTGNYGTYPLFIGARNNASLFLNGSIYSLIVAGTAVSAGNITATEQWVAGKTGITI